MDPEGRVRDLSIVIVTTIPATLYHLWANQIPYFVAEGFRVTMISSDGEWISAFDVEKRYGIKPYTVTFTREYSIVRDILALWRLYMLLKKVRPDIVHYCTPKAAFLCSLAGFFAGIQKRIYSIFGTVYYGEKWPARKILEVIEWVTCLLSTVVLAVSNSNRDYIVGKKLCPSGKIRILAKGSSQGVDAQKRFNPRNLDAGKLENIKKELAVVPGAVVIGYIGRIAEDKGIGELLTVWREIHSDIPGGRLLLIGPLIEKRNRVSEILLRELSSEPSVLMVPAVDTIEYYYPLIDILVLPSHREGFPNVVLEAGAMEVPVITYDTLGCIDSVVDNVTGFIVPFKDTAALAQKILLLAGDPILRKTFGRNARIRALADFDPENINRELLEIYYGT
jgi:glycosyltransferase involved in cell wall biosynthesis